ncbi:MAG: hypothetical protein KBA46_07605, partial [Candidatus Omnitrophica bacterium]|nr:hypothetical protein [Candidatus Omnitrophota bacterium]
MKKRTIGDIFLLIVSLALVVVFVIKFAGPRFLRLYIRQGIGTCESIPNLCMAPTMIEAPEVDKSFADSLVRFKFPNLAISAPKRFRVIQQRLSKTFYQTNHQQYKGDVIYFLYQPPDFFIDLYPHLRKEGVENDYIFVRRLMHANSNTVRNLVDTFFVIMKGIFTPSLGSASQITMVEFKDKKLKGFISYALDPKGNYFDCNVFDNEGHYFKVYIKDKSAT